MSFDKIQLPGFLIADLYKDSLVDFNRDDSTQPVILKEKPKPAIVEAVINHAKTLEYLGENKNNTIIIVNQPDALIIQDQELVFLINILKACNLNLGDIAIINIYPQDVLFTLIKEQLDAEKIILFDVAPSAINLPFSIPDFQVHNYAGCTILTAPALSILNQPTEDGRMLKSKLWMSLKQLFDI